MRAPEKTTDCHRPSGGLRLILAVLIPLGACGAQFFFWATLQPYAWLLFYPAVFLSAWVGGRRGGLVATALSTGLVWYFFIPPRLSFAIENPSALVSVGLFVSMGILFSHFHERLWRANELAADAQFRVLFEQASVGMTQAGLDGRFQRVNQRLCDIVGYTREELLGKTLRDITHPDELGADAALLPKVLASERSTCVLERQWRRKDQSSVTVNVTVALIREASGAPKYFILVVEDVTERKRAAVATAELAAIVHSSLDAIIGKNLDGIVTSWNAGAEKIFGYAAGEMIGCSITKLIPPDHKGDEERILAEIKRGESVQHFETVRVRKDGGLIDVSVTVSPIKDASGEIVGASKVARNITARKKAEKELKESEERFRTLVETAPEAIFIQTNRCFAYANAAALRLFGATRPEELAGQPVLDRFHPDFHARVAERMRRSNQERVESADEVCLTLAGDAKDVNVSAVPFTFQNQIGALVFARDITERKLAEEKIKRTMADLERSNKDLEHFAYVASHDLQEPLRMVSSYTQLLEQYYGGQLDDKARKYIRYAVDGAVRMQSLINDLLTYSRVGRRGKPLEAVDSHTVLGEAIRNLSSAIEETHAVITNDDLPTVWADATQLVLVFQNLLANAIKFRRAEVPRVHVSARKQGGNWEFAVKDNGIGIEAQYAKRVFIVFQRLHTREEYPGTGIGLAVCQRIVERHGGKIWLESQPGNGTTFFFTIPTTQTESPNSIPHSL